VRLDRERALHVLHRAPVTQHFRTLTIIHVYVLQRALFLELDGHVGGGAHCEAEVVGAAVALVGRRGYYCGVNISGGGAGAVASATDGESSEERFEENGE
jgi:hypothetical protein